MEEKRDNMQPFGRVKRIVPAGMDALILYFSGNTIKEANDQVHRMVQALIGARFSWLTNYMPSYDSLVVVFDPLQCDSHAVYHALRQLNLSGEISENRRDTVTLPVWYGAPDASDFDEITSHTGLDRDDIIRLHLSVTYRVFTVGFAPGFAYLGELPAALACPRRSSPRKRVPMGAVAIADRQTAVYPAVSPGGWQLIGLCPLAMYQPAQKSPSRLKAGDTVKFEAIDEHQYKGMLND